MEEIETKEVESLESKLTPKQELFCNEYLKDLNATQAAIRAEYSIKTAKSQGSRLLTNVDVASRIVVLNGERLKEVKIDANFVLNSLKEIADSNISEMFNNENILLPLKEMPLNVQKSIQSFEVEEDHRVDSETGEISRTTKTVKVKFWSKDRSLENLGKHLKLFTDKVEISGDLGFAEELKRARERNSDS